MPSGEKRVNIAYIGGGSVGFGWSLLAGLAGEEICASVRLYDIDKQLSLANEVIGNKFREYPESKGDVIYLASDTPEETLKGAQIVILSFSPGTMDEKAAEISLPERYGIYHSSGKHTGPSGIIKALKNIPMCIKYAELVKKICPSAWVINLTNPLQACTLAMYRAFPEIKLFGSTGELFPVLDILAKVAEKEFGVKGVRRREIKYNLLGIGGFGWLNEAKYYGEDLMPAFKKYAEKYYEVGYNFISDGKEQDSNKIRFDLFLRYGLISAAPDAITAVFCPPWYLRSLDVMKGWELKPVNLSHMKKAKLDRLGRVKALMNGDEFLNVGTRDTDCHLQVKALLGMGNLISNICVRNAGQVENLPIGAIVHTNALISRDSVKPVMAGKLPEEVYGLTVRHTVNQSVLVKAVFGKDLDVAFNAFLNDPIMSLDLNEATVLYKEMLAAVRMRLLYYC